MLDGLIAKILRTTLLQATDIIPFLGGIIVAPLFFISLLHPFKRASIANFRWAILLMWVTAALGLAFFGISKDPLDPNQLHLLFAPIMTAYGLAFISILWSRLEFVASTPILRNVHHFVIVGICALPLVLALPQKVRVGMHLRDRGGVPHWPPYYAPALNSKKAGIKGWTNDKQVIFADQPWAVAWYADRISIWLPPTYAGFEKIETIAAGPPDTRRRRPDFPAVPRLRPAVRSRRPIQGLHLHGARWQDVFHQLPERRLVVRQGSENPGRRETLSLPRSRWWAWTWSITATARSARRPPN